MYLLYASKHAACPSCANVVPAANIPLAVPGGNPVMADPGQTPPFPGMAVAPVLVSVEPLSAPKDLARPMRTGRARFSGVGAAREREGRRRARMGMGESMVRGWGFGVGGEEWSG